MHRLYATSCVGIIFFVEFLCGDNGNLLGEGRDVEQVARTLKHILVFAFAISHLNSTCLYLVLLLLLIDIVPRYVVIQGRY